MKKLKVANIGYPIYAVETTFAYRKVGKPTVFDELLMSLAIEFPQLHNNSLAQIANILKLDENFIHRSLETMCDTGMIEIDETNDLNQIQLADLTLTNIGRQFYQNKQIPSRRRTAHTEFYFNPISLKYSDKPNTSDKGDILLEQSLFPVNDNVLQGLSQQEVPHQYWYDDTVQVEENGIEHYYVEQQGFQTVKVQLSLDNNRYLQIESSDVLFNSWLKSRSSEVVNKHILTPLLKPSEDALRLETLNNDLFELVYQDDELLSLVLAEQKTDMSAVKNAITVKFSDKQKVDTNTPAIIFSNSLNEPQLDGKHLIVNAEIAIDGITQLLLNFKNNDVYIEEMGYLPCYFDHQPYHLPVKILTKQQQTWISDLDVFHNPNRDTLVFMANFLSENELLDKMPKMNLTHFDEFYQKIKKTWDKKLILNSNWVSKTDLISDEKTLTIFVKYFKETTLLLKNFTTNFQSQLFDLAIKNEKSPACQIVELSDLLKFYPTLKVLKEDKLDLKSINPQTITLVRNMQNMIDDLRLNYPRVFSDSLNNLVAQIEAWQAKISDLFIIKQGKFAVLDTNFIRKNSKETLVEITRNHTTILPSVVLDELDYQKEKSKKDIQAAANTLSEKEEKVQTALYKVGELTDQIKSIDTDFQKVQEELADIQQQLKVLREREKQNG